MFQEGWAEERMQDAASKQEAARIGVAGGANPNPCVSPAGSALAVSPALLMFPFPQRRSNERQAVRRPARVHVPTKLVVGGKL